MNYTGHERFNELGIPHVDTTNLQPFSRSHVRTITSHIVNGERLTIADADQYLETTFNGDPGKASQIVREFLPAAGLLAAAAAAHTGLQLDPALADVAPLPSAVHDFLNNIWSAVPYGNEHAETNGVLEHLPPALSFAAAASGAIAGLRQIARPGLEYRAKLAQDTLRTNVTQGQQWWDTASEPDSLVAFVGTAKALPDALAEELSARTVVMTHDPTVLGATVLYPENSSPERIVKAFGQAGASRTKHALIFTGPTDEIFPDQKNRGTYSAGVATVEGLIRCLDKSMEHDKTWDGTLLPVTIVGSRSQPIITAIAKGSDSDEISVEQRSETLGSRIDKLNLNRQPPVDIIDSTEIVLRAIFKLATNRPLYLAGDPESNAIYAKNFFEEASQRVDVDQTAEPMDVVFGRSDRMTASIVSQRDSVYVVRDLTRAASIRETLPARSDVVAIDDVLLQELTARIRHNTVLRRRTRGYTP